MWWDRTGMAGCGQCVESKLEWALNTSQAKKFITKNKKSQTVYTRRTIPSNMITGQNKSVHNKLVTQ